MISKDKLISVIIPVYNSELFLGEAIESVLAQDYRPIEVIVVNDGSTDNTETIAKRYRDHILYTKQENRGPAAARNKGLELARGDIISFLDADDLWPEKKLSLQLACLAEDPSLEIVLGLSQVMKLQDGDDKLKFKKWNDPMLLLLFGAAVIRKSVFEKVGFFDETLHHNEDTDWFMRIRERGITITLLKEVTLLYRRHESNMTLDSTARNRYFVRALKKSIDRRRQKGSGQVASVPKLHNLESVTGYSQDPAKCAEIKCKGQKET